MYRARIGNFLTKPDCELKSPPKEIAKDGRGNPKGISYFYTAIDKETAIAEVRPSIGEEVTVAKFRAQKDMRLLTFEVLQNNLNKSKQDSILTPLQIEILRLIVESLNKPVPPTKSLDYLPTQYITEYVKSYTGKFGKIDGFLYKSSLTQKSNIVYFSDNDFELVEPRELCIINDIKYAYGS